MDDGEFEDLAQPPRREWHRLARLRTPLLALAGAGVIAAGVLTVADTEGKAARAAPTPSKSVTIALGTRTPRPPDVLPAGPGVVVGSAAHLSGRLPLCPDDRICAVSYTPSREVRAALRHYLPDLRTVTGRSLIARRLNGQSNKRPFGSNVLVGRVLEARTRTLRIEVEVRRPQPGDAGTDVVTDTTGSQVVGLAQETVDGFTVTVLVIGPPGTPVSVDDLNHLATDPRLLVRE